MTTGIQDVIIFSGLMTAVDDIPMLDFAIP